MHRLIQPYLPRHRRLERFTRLGTVGQRGAEGKDAQPSFRLQFVSLVSMEQTAHVCLQPGICPVRQQILQAVQQINPAFSISIILQSAAFDETEAVAGTPDGAESQFQIMIDFFKNKLVAGNIFIQMAVAVVNARVAIGKWFPEMSTLALSTVEGARHEHNRLAPRQLTVRGDFVFRFVGEEGRIGIDAPGRQATGAGNEQPMIGCSGHRCRQ